MKYLKIDSFIKERADPCPIWQLSELNNFQSWLTPIWQLEYHWILFSCRAPIWQYSILNTFNTHPYLTIIIFDNCLNWTHPYLTMEFDQRIVLHPRAPSRHSAEKNSVKDWFERYCFYKSGNWILNTGDLNKDAYLMLLLNPHLYSPPGSSGSMQGFGLGVQS